MSQITCEHRDHNAYTMSDFWAELFDPHPWQQIIGKQDADPPSLGDSQEIDKRKNPGGAADVLCAFFKNKHFCKDKRHGHSCKISKDNGNGIVHPEIIKDSAAKIDRGGDSACEKEQEELFGKEISKQFLPHL